MINLRGEGQLAAIADVRAKGSTLSLIALMFAFTVGVISSAARPLWIGSVQELHGLSLSEGALVGALDLGCTAIAAIVTGLFARTRTRPSNVMLACGLNALGNIGCAFVSGLLPLAMLRIVCGLSAGYALPLATRAAALQPNPGKAFALQQFGLVIIVVGYFLGVSWLLNMLGSAVSFYLLALVSALAAIMAMFWPAPARAVEETEQDHGKVAVVPGRWSRSMIIFLAILLMYSAESMVFSNLQAVAKFFNVSIATLSTVLAFQSAFNVLAPMASARLAGKMLRLPLLAGSGALAFFLLIVCLTDRLGFIFGTIFLNWVLLFTLPFILSLLVVRDHTGRTASVGPAFTLLGAALGAFLGGVALQYFGLVVLGITASLSALFSLIILWPLAQGSWRLAINGPP